MWQILVFLTGGLGFFLVLILIIVICFAETSWQAMVFGGICALITGFLAKEISSDKVKSARRKRKAAKRREKQKRIQKALMKKENSENF